nr:chloride channel protein [Anaerolineae bacterium]
MDKRLMSEARRHRVIFTMMAAIAVLTGLIVIAQAALFSQIVSRAHLGGASAADLTSLLIGLGVVLVARAVLAGAITRLSGRLAATIKADLRGRLLARLVALGPTYLHGQRTGEISHLLTDGADGFDPFFRDLLPALLIAAAVPVMVVLAVLPVDLLTFAILCITAPLIPLLGGIVIGLLRWQIKDFGPGLTTLIEVVQGSREVLLLNPVTKMVTASLSLGSGASLGPEGPSVEIGAYFSLLLGQALKVSQERRKLLLSAGAAAGLAAGFNAPIAGVFFALEVILGTTFVASTASVVLLAAVVAAWIAQIGLGSQPAFALPAYEVRSLLELPLYVGLGLLASLVSLLYVQAL